MTVGQHQVMADGDVEACVNCGREPWMVSFGAPCPGPHPDVVAVMTDWHLRLGWRDVVASAAVLIVFVSTWAAAGAIGWAAWRLVH